MNIELDEVIDVTVAAGIISSEGRAEINQFLRRLGNPVLPDWWDWHTRVGGKGEYVGSFPKRVAKYYWQTIKHKLSSDDLGTIGSIMSQHTNRDNQYSFDFTDSFNWQAGDYGDAGSCFWSCHKAAREALEEHGAKAVRFYGDGGGYARAWLVKRSDYYVVFNGYGLETSDIARILSHYWGVSYRKISLDNHGDSSGLIWINSGVGYVVGPESVVNGKTYVNMEIDGGSTCAVCNCLVDENETCYVDSLGDLCVQCFHDDYSYCEDCSEVIHNEDIYQVIGPHGEEYICEYCRQTNFTKCDDCGEYHLDSKILEINSKDVCQNCVDNGAYFTCDCCEEIHENSTEVGDLLVCDNCIEDYTCSNCNSHATNMDKVHDKLVCSNCIDEVEVNEYPLLVGCV